MPMVIIIIIIRIRIIDENPVVVQGGGGQSKECGRYIGEAPHIIIGAAVGTLKKNQALLLAF